MLVWGPGRFRVEGILGFCRGPIDRINMRILHSGSEARDKGGCQKPQVLWDPCVYVVFGARIKGVEMFDHVCKNACYHGYAFAGRPVIIQTPQID